MIYKAQTADESKIVIGILVSENTIEDYKGEQHQVKGVLEEVNPLIFAKKRYTKGKEFLSATGNLKFPIKITEIRMALHEDRTEEISLLKTLILKEWLKISPKSAKINKKHKNYATFYENTYKHQKRILYLQSLKNDIVESEIGGVIYCAMEDKWAKIV